MTKILLWAVCLISAGVLSSCSSDSPTTPSTTQLSTQKLTQLTGKEKPEAAVQQFLSWYQQNHERLAAIPLIPASLDNDTTNVYAVDFGAADQYLTSLRSSGFISETYITGERQYLQKADSLLRNEPQTDGPPVGFNYDRIVFSQDTEAAIALLFQDYSGY